jgi:hypothetical protein
VVTVWARRPPDSSRDRARDDAGASGAPGRFPRGPVGDPGGRERGQVYTLEGLTAALLVLIALLYALQAVVLTPTTPGTIDRETRADLKTQGEDVLAAAHSNGTLSTAIRYWNTSASAANRSFYNPNPGPGPNSISVSPRFGYGQDDPPGELGAMLNQTFTQRGLSYNVFIEYQAAPDWTERKRVVLLRRGYPTDNAIAATYPVALYDDMRITAPSSDKRLANTSNFYAEDADPDGPLYNLVVIRVVVW